MTDTGSPLISVVIPVYNGKGTIEDCIDCLYNSDFRLFEVIVVDDHSTDGALRPLASFPFRVITNNKERGVSGARNLGIQEARGKIILLLDADILVPADFLGRVEEFFRMNPEASFLQGAYDPDSYYKNVMSEYKNLVFSFRAHQEGKGLISFIHSACVAGRSEIFKQYLFDTRFLRREDIECGLRISRDGFKIYHDPDLKVKHKKKLNFFGFLRYQFSAASQMVLQRSLKDDKNISWELKQPKTKFYKKTWFLRPLVSAGVTLGLLSLLPGSYLLFKFIFWGSLVALFIFDAPFLGYLLRFAPKKVFFLAPVLYILDGLACGCGIIGGLWKACIAHGVNTTEGVGR